MQSFWGDCLAMQVDCMAGRKQVNEEALRRVLARLKAQGWAVATQDLPTEPDPQLDQGPRQAPPIEPVPPSSADEVGDLPPELASSVDLPEQVPPTEPSPSPSADEVAALPLDAFAGRSLMVKVWSRLLDGEIWFVSGEVQVRILQGRGVPRGEIFTGRELADLLELFDRDAEKARLVLEAKRLFEGSLRIEKAP